MSRALKILQLAQQKQELKTASHETIVFKSTAVSTADTQPYSDAITILNLDSNKRITTMSSEVVNYENIVYNEDITTSSQIIPDSVSQQQLFPLGAELDASNDVLNRPVECTSNCQVSTATLDIQPPVTPTPTDPYSSDDSVADKDFSPSSGTDSESANNSLGTDSDDQASPLTTDGQSLTTSGPHNTNYLNSTTAVLPKNHNKISKKRKRAPATWKRNDAKIKRLKGSPYKSCSARKNVEVPERKVKPPCICRQKCYLKITPEQRETLFKYFWKVTTYWSQRRQYIVSLVPTKPKERTRSRKEHDESKRQLNYLYSLPLNDGKDMIQVCKVMFLNTFCLGEKFVKNAIYKRETGGMVSPDGRLNVPPHRALPDTVKDSVIKHIQSYPSYVSHYCRERTQKRYLGSELNISIMYKQYIEKCENSKVPKNLIAKEWLYRDTFNTEFNLSFHAPGVDTCDDCDRYVKLLAENNANTETIREEQKLHHEEANRRYELKKKDKLESTHSGGSKVTAMVDLQKCLSTPSLTNGQSFYLRKLWTLNLTIFEATTNTAHNMIWNESIGQRGAHEIGSCIIKWATDFLPHSVQEVTIWSDNCQGQNRNLKIVLAHMWILRQCPHIKVINHKFLLKGHTDMEADMVHSIIERKKARLKNLDIIVPRDWAQFIRTCNGKINFNVHEMEFADFKNLSILMQHSKSPLISRKKNANGEIFSISKVVWLQVKQDTPGILYYKTNFSQEAFLEVNLKRNTRLPVTWPETLTPVRTRQCAITPDKYKHLQTLLQWIPTEFHSFYQGLKTSEEAQDYPESDSENQ